MIDYYAVENLNKNIFLELELLKKCNLNCFYCCAESIKIKDSLTDKERFIFYKNVINKLNKKTHIRLMGGEPLLFKYLKPLIDVINDNEFVTGVTLFSNGTKDLSFLSNSKIRYIVTSLHLQYPKLYDIIINNCEKSNITTIFNCMVDKFEDYPNFIQLNNALKKISNSNNYAHVQLLFKSEGYYYNNWLKWYNFINLQSKCKEFYNKFCDYPSIIKKYFSAKRCICNCNCFNVSSNLKIKCDCEKLNFNNFDKIKTICNNINCYYDNFLYYENKIF